jgi:hypothetical protein
MPFTVNWKVGHDIRLLLAVLIGKYTSLLNSFGPITGLLRMIRATIKYFRVVFQSWVKNDLL